MSPTQNRSLDITSGGISPAAHAPINDKLATRRAPPPPKPGCYFWLSLGSTAAYVVLSHGLHGHGVFLLDAFAKAWAKLT